MQEAQQHEHRSSTQLAQQHVSIRRAAQQAEEEEDSQAQLNSGTASAKQAGAQSSQTQHAHLFPPAASQDQSLEQPKALLALLPWLSSRLHLASIIRC